MKWYIPPLAAGETVDHFCLKAVVTSDNDVNTYNNEVQSNIAYAPYTPGTPFRLPFIVTNPLDEEIALELKVQGLCHGGGKRDSRRHPRNPAETP